MPKQKKIINPSPDMSSAPFEIFNIGNNKPVKLMKYIKIIEKNLKRKAKINYLPLQPGDIKSTRASMVKIKNKLNWKPEYSFQDLINEMIDEKNNESK